MEDTELDHAMGEPSPGGALSFDPPTDLLPDPLADSPLFDPDHYARAAGVSGTRSELLRHYLQAGEAKGVQPSAQFEPLLYAMLHPDVVAANAGLLRHYVEYGQAERRYATRAALAADAAALEASGLFDAGAFARHLGHPPRAGLSFAEEYVAASTSNAPAGPAFDGAFYQSCYPDVRAAAAPPLLHYIRTGRAECRVCTPHDLHERMEVCRPVFHEAFYRNQLPPDGQPADALRHYILEGSRRGYDPAPGFSGAYYQRLYPDMAAGAMDPFFHFARWGMGEGRVGRPDFSAAYGRGSRTYDLRKPTVLLTSHEATRTGAPLVALNIAERLAPTHNVVMVLARGGEIAAEFARHSVLVVTIAVTPLDAEYLLAELRHTHAVQAVLLNSVETSPFGPAALQNGLPSVALVHEFASYTLPMGRMSELAESVNRVVTPAALIRDSLEGELQALRNGPGNHVSVRPQGCLPSLPPSEPGRDLSREELRMFLGAAPGQTKVVLGAGYAQIRKGLDLFVQTAAEFRAIEGTDVRFLWIGSNYHPATDAVYGVFVADMVRRLDMQDIVSFLPSQGSLDAAFEVADAFYLPSRLDPFPNVVLDALRAGKPVVCFDRATGVAEHMRDQPGPAARGASRRSGSKAVGAAVPFCDVRAAALALAALCRPAEQKRAAGNALFVKRHFAFDDYMADLLRLLDEARADQAALEQAVDAVEATGLFDGPFHDGARLTDAGATRRAIRLYVARAQKGLAYASPRPGFHEAAARARSGRPGPALLPGPGGALPEPTHCCVVMPSGLPPFAGRIGLHLHLHYADLAPSFAADLQAAGCEADLVITTTSTRSRIEAEYAFRAHRGSVQVLTVPNKGRDIGPFLGDAGRLLRGGGYDVVGHLHGKRSVEAGGATGDRWRTYLLVNLLGLGAGGTAAVLAPFAADPALGLLFAEDRHCVGWGGNRASAEALAARMAPQPVLPTAPVFPLGTMFWARPGALEPLWALGIQNTDLPPEPLPYDGTVLHAIERMLPAVCEAANYGWCTVFKPGTGW